MTQQSKQFIPSNQPHKGYHFDPKFEKQQNINAKLKSYKSM